jgi:hypothetical protein
MGGEVIRERPAIFDSLGSDIFECNLVSGGNSLGLILRFAAFPLRLVLDPNLRVACPRDSL